MIIRLTGLSRAICFFLILVMTLLSGCSSIVYAPDQAPRMVVLHDEVAFFLHGPAQGNGADRSLAKGDEVKVLRKEFGYSFVQLNDGQKGFVANEELVVAPPMPSPTPGPTSNASPFAPTNLWPEQKKFPDSFDADSNSPVAPPGFRY